MRRFLILVILTLPTVGCMRTQHIEVCSTSTCDGMSAAHNSTYSERRWLGFWPGPPSRVQP